MFLIDIPTADIGAATPPAHDDWWYTDTPGVLTQSGNRITAESAIRVTAVWSCLRLLTESIGQLPLHLYRRNGEDKERVTDHPAARLVARPNDEQTRMEMVEHATYHVESCGASYWEIVPGRGRRAVLGSLIPHLPADVTPLYNGRPLNLNVPMSRIGRVTYRVRDGDGSRIVPAAQMVHFRGGMMRHPLQSLSPIGEMREAIGATEAASAYGSRFFRNDATPRGFLKWPGKIKDEEAADEVRRRWLRGQGGLRQHSIAVLSSGLEYAPLGISNEDAQFIETRKYNATDIARVWRVPAHMINETTGAIKANVEQMGLEYVTYSLMARLTRNEQRLNHSLLGPEERDEYFFEYLVDGLLRADIRSRYFAYRQATGGAPWKTPNEIRKLENDPPHPDGDRLAPPPNMSLGPGPDGRGGTEDSDEQEIEDEEREERANALAEAEIAEISAELGKRSPGRFLNFARVFYDRMAARAAVELDISLDQGRAYAERSYAELVAARDADGMQRVVDGWRTSKPSALTRLL